MRRMQKMRVGRVAFIGLVCSVGMNFVSMASKQNVAVVAAKVHQLEKPDPFLQPYFGDDIEGIEAIVRDISACREDWRKDAEKRIENHRKEDLHIKIVRRNGQPFDDEQNIYKIQL